MPRAALLAAAGLRFETRPAHIDEAEVKRRRAEGAAPADTALLLAELKAARVRDPDALVIGATSCWSATAMVRQAGRTARRAGAAARAARPDAYAGHRRGLPRGGQRIWHHVASRG